MGRPPSKNPKDYEFRIRLDNESKEKLEHCAEKKNTSKSEVVREGIELVYREIGGK